MKVSDIFEQLTYGELKQHGLGGYDTKGVAEEDYPEVTSHLNLALLNLYTRFPILEKEFFLNPIIGQSLYEINSSNALSSGNADWFIEDSVEVPFLDDIIRMSAIYDVYGNELPFNDENAETSVFTPKFNTLQIPEEVSGPLSVIYRAKAPKVVAPAEDDTEEAYAAFLDTEVIIPEVLMEAAFAFIEYRVSKALGTESGISQASIAKQNYELLCTEAERRNLLNTSVNPTNTKPEMRGFV